jgi:hypothetical protein
MKVLHVTGEYPCPRASKIALATGWSEAVSRRLPQAFPDAFTKVTWRPEADAEWFRDRIAESDADAVMLHVELYTGWLAEAAREGTGDRPLIVNIHDVTAARTGYVPDLYEHLLYRVADALMFTAPEQRENAESYGFDTDKACLIVPNYPSSSMFVDKPLLPHIGGVVYEGGLDARGAEGAWRDLSPVADALQAAGGGLHIYPANTGVDYGILYDMVLDYRVLIHHLARHDWGLSGTAKPELSWLTTTPNKAFDYMSAGIPFVALNTPVMMPWVEEGLGIHIDDVRHLNKLPDPKPFKKAIKANRHRFTMESLADSIKEFVEAL